MRFGFALPAALRVLRHPTLSARCSTANKASACVITRSMAPSCWLELALDVACRLAELPIAVHGARWFGEERGLV
jgi:hypothetical protein